MYEARGSAYGAPSFRAKFWHKRVVRLAPTYFVALLMFAPLLVAAWGAIDVLPFGHEPTRVVAVVATALGIQAWDPTVPLWRLWNYPAWAVSDEAVFYFLFPFLMPILKPIVAVSRRGAYALLCLMWIAQLFVWLGYTSLLEMSGFGSGEAADVTYTFPLVRIFEFMVGLVLGLMALRGPCVAASSAAADDAAGRRARAGLYADLAALALVVLFAVASFDIQIPMLVVAAGPLTAVFVYYLSLDRGCGSARAKIARGAAF